MRCSWCQEFGCTSAVCGRCEPNFGWTWPEIIGAIALAAVGMAWFTWLFKFFSMVLH